MQNKRRGKETAGAYVSFFLIEIHQFHQGFMQYITMLFLETFASGYNGNNIWMGILSGYKSYS